MRFGNMGAFFNLGCCQKKTRRTNRYDLSNRLLGAGGHRPFWQCLKAEE
jgi:hypothetical protein